MYILCRHPNPRHHSISFAATLRRHPILHHHPNLRCSCQPPPAPPAQDRYSLDLISHHKMRHNNKRHNQ